MACKGATCGGGVGGVAREIWIPGWRDQRTKFE